MSQSLYQQQQQQRERVNNKFLFDFFFFSQMLTLATLPSKSQVELSYQLVSFTECSPGQSDLQTGYDQIPELPGSTDQQDLTWISSPQGSDFSDNEPSLEEISWLTQSPSYESVDSLDSFSSLNSSCTAYSLPPTPPATPPNSAQWLPAEAKSTRFSCSECCKVFGDRAHLSEHHRYRHSDERPHRCPTCSKGFKSRSNLNQHIRTAHERPRFDCKVIIPTLQCDIEWPCNHLM